MALTINLPQHLQDYLAREVAAGRFPDAESAVIDAVERAQDNYPDDPELAASFAELRRGELLALTPALRAEIRADAMRNLRDGRVVRGDITY